MNNFFQKLVILKIKLRQLWIKIEKQNANEIIMFFIADLELNDIFCPYLQFGLNLC